MTPFLSKQNGNAERPCCTFPSGLSNILIGGPNCIVTYSFRIFNFVFISEEIDLSAGFYF